MGVLNVIKHAEGGLIETYDWCHKSVFTCLLMWIVSCACAWVCFPVEAQGQHSTPFSVDLHHFICFYLFCESLSLYLKLIDSDKLDWSTSFWEMPASASPELGWQNHAVMAASYMGCRYPKPDTHAGAAGGRFFTPCLAPVSLKWE